MFNVHSATMLRARMTKLTGKQSERVMESWSVARWTSSQPATYTMAIERVLCAFDGARATTTTTTNDRETRKQNMTMTKTEESVIGI